MAERKLDSVELNDVTSTQEFARRIAERAAKTAKANGARRRLG